MWLNLTIAATSDRCCPAKFSWSLNGKNMPKTSLHEYPYSYHLGRNVAILAIRVDGPEAEVKELVGRYRCDVWHSVYSQNRTVTVDVRVKPLREPGRCRLWKRLDLCSQLRGYFPPPPLFFLGGRGARVCVGETDRERVCLLFCCCL